MTNEVNNSVQREMSAKFDEWADEYQKHSFGWSIHSCRDAFEAGLQAAQVQQEPTCKFGLQVDHFEHQLALVRLREASQLVVKEGSKFYGFFASSPPIPREMIDGLQEALEAIK